MTTSSSVCKHMFLAHTVYAHDLCFETRKGGSFEAGEFSVSSLEFHQPSDDNEVRQEKINQKIKVSIEQIRSVISCIANCSNASEEQAEALAVLAAQASNVKRNFESTDNNWSKRQRR